MASCHSKFAVYDVINSKTIVRVHLGTYIENANIYGINVIFLRLLTYKLHRVTSKLRNPEGVYVKFARDPM